MSDLEQRIKAFARAELDGRMKALEISADEIDDEFNLVHSGLLDSMGFVEFVGRVEQEFGLEVDFEGVDPAEFTTVGGFARCAARRREQQ